MFVVWSMKKDYDWRQIQVTWNDWACGCMGQLLTCAEEDRQPGGLDCGSWYVSKNRQPPLLLRLLCSSEQMLITVCFQKEAIIESEEKTHLLLINPHQIIRWLTASEYDSHVGHKRRVKRFLNDKKKTKLKVLRVACSQDRVSGTRLPQASSPDISLLINSSTAAWPLLLPLLSF